MSWLFKDPVVIMKEIMSWMFQDPVNSAWLILTMANQTVKNGLKAKKIKLPQVHFSFLKRQLIKFSCTYWLLSFCKILKKFLGLIQSYDEVPFLGPKWPICHKQKIFGTNHYYYFHLTIDPFHCPKLFKNSSESWVTRVCHFLTQNGSFAPNKFFFQKINIIFIYLLAPFILLNFKKILRANPELWGCVIFGLKILQFVQNKFFLVQTIIISFIYLLALFIGQNSKKNSSSGSTVMRMCNFWAHNDPFSQIRIFFQKTCK